MKGLAQFFHIGNMDRCVDRLDAAIWIGFGTADGFLDGAATFDDDLAFRSIDAENGALFAFVVAGDDFDLVAFFDVCLDGAHWKTDLKVREPRERGRRFS